MVILPLMLLIIAAGSIPQEESFSWPVISEFSREYQFDEPSHPMVEVTIFGQTGTPKYKLECHNHFFDAGAEFSYSGDFECRLGSLYSKETVSTLFAYTSHQTADWESRAIFYAAHFVGACKDSKFGGAARVFRLRNMQITLEILDETVEVVGNFAQFKEFRFKLTVSRDETAIRAIANEIPPSELPDWFHRPGECLK